MTTSKKYTVVGPMTKGNDVAHVHIAGCRDLRNLRIYRGQEKHTVEAESPLRAAWMVVLDAELGYTDANAKVFPCCGPVRKDSQTRDTALKAVLDAAQELGYTPKAETAPGTGTGKLSKRARAKKAVEEKAPAKRTRNAKKAPAPSPAPSPEKAPAKRLELTTKQRDYLQTQAINTPTKDEIGAKGKMVTVTAEFVKDLVWLAQVPDKGMARVFSGLQARTQAWVAEHGVAKL